MGIRAHVRREVFASLRVELLGGVSMPQQFGHNRLFLYRTGAARASSSSSRWARGLKIECEHFVVTRSIRSNSPRSLSVLVSD